VRPRAPGLRHERELLVEIGDRAGAAQARTQARTLLELLLDPRPQLGDRGGGGPQRRSRGKQDLDAALRIDTHLQAASARHAAHGVGALLDHAGEDNPAMGETSIVRLPASVDGPFEVYVNGVLQRPGVDYERDGNVLRFPRRLARDRVKGWRWLVGAFGVGTYRQDDSVDVRYERDGQPRLAESLEIENGE